MKNNKGYSLVELMIAVLILVIVMAEIGALMINSQSLYKNGYFEVNLQENAQTIITQVQDMLVNVNNVTKDYDEVQIVPHTSPEGIDSDVLKIITYDRTYNSEGVPIGWATSPTTILIGRDVDLGIESAMKGTDGKKYSKLYMQKDGSDIPIADGVHKIKLTKTHFSNSDVITIALEMQNQQYSFASQSEIYLRNQPGTNGPEMPPISVVTGSDVDLTILRIHEYDLTNYVPDGYDIFKWDDVNPDNITSLYTLGEDGSLTCNSLNSNWKDKVDKATIIAGRGGSYTDSLKITIHTDPVNDGNHMPLYVYSGTTAEVRSPMPVTGICVCDACVDDIYWDGQMTIDYTANEVAGETPTLALYKNSSNGNIHFKQHEDDTNTPKHYTKGAGFVDEENEMTKLSDEIFYRVEGKNGGKISFKEARFNVSLYKLKEGNTDTEFLDGKVNVNYDKIVDNVQWPCYPSTDGNAWGGTYSLITTHDEQYDIKKNAFVFCTTEQCDYSYRYWNNIVDFDGYVRIHLYCTFNGLAYGEGIWKNQGLDYVYDTYAYLYPQGSGSDDQHKDLMGSIANVSSTNDKDKDGFVDYDAKPHDDKSNKDPYGEYYNHDGKILITK